MIIVSGSADRSIIVWNLQSGNRLYDFNQPTDEVYAVDLSADGRFVAAGGRDGKARIWDLSEGKLIAELLE
jgi:WD40 repeat protein